MSNDVVIKVENLSKRYRLGLIGGKTLREDVQRWWAKFRGRPDPLLPVDYVNPSSVKSDSLINKSGSDTDNGDQISDNQPPSGIYIWALKDVSFEVKQGEILGIIGRNGAGKSTLLKILTKITAPTYGVAKIKGRVGSLLEVGTGFHPELTGRENIFLNGAILGMTRAEIRRKFDEIVDFAEIEKFIDTPVKRYSSGMYVRLAFAVAAHLEPEILLVDEVLAVGDMEFQKKCLQKMKAIGDIGRTVLFVSHNLQAIQRLCERCLWIGGGKIIEDAEVSHVVSSYAASQIGINQLSFIPNQRTNNGLFNLESVYLDGKHNNGVFSSTEPIYITFNFEVLKSLEALRIGFDLKDNIGTLLLRSFEDDDVLKGPSKYKPGRYTTMCLIPENFFQEGEYTIDLCIGIHRVKWIDRHEKSLIFSVQNSKGVNSHYGHRKPGILNMLLNWSRANNAQVDK